MIDNKYGLRCTWCGNVVDTIREPDVHDRQIIGICDDDGIVYVTPDGGDDDV